MSASVSLTVFAVWLIAMLGLLRRGIPLGSVILWASVGISLALGRGFMGLSIDAWIVTLDPQVLELLGIVLLIYLLSFLLKATHRIERITEYLIRVLRDPRLVLMAVPSLVGLIPMPGGAMFTAPITDEMGNRLNLSPEDKVLSNYWFRHCWELAFPLYPGVVLAAGILKVSPGEITGACIPLALVAFLGGGGYCWLRWDPPASRDREVAPAETAPGANSAAVTAGGVAVNVTESLRKHDVPTSPELKSIADVKVGESLMNPGLLTNRAPSAGAVTGALSPHREPGFWTLWPLLAVVLLALLRIPLVVGLLVIITAFAVTERVSVREFFGYVRQSLNPGVIVLIWAVFLFSRTLHSTQVLQHIGAFFLQVGMPLWVISGVLPFALGALTGVTTGFVGPIFPLLLPMWGSDVMVWAPYAYASGLAGVFLTPSHLCLSLTQEYFKASLTRTIALLVPVVFLVWFTALVRVILL